MGKNRRSDIEIIGKILLISQNGARKTEILYQANLSYELLQDYMFLLINKRFLEEKIEKNNGSKELRKYHTTDDGNDLLITIDNVYKFFNKNTG